MRLLYVFMARVKHKFYDDVLYDERKGNRINGPAVMMNSL